MASGRRSELGITMQLSLTRIEGNPVGRLLRRCIGSTAAFHLSLLSPSLISSFTIHVDVSRLAGRQRHRFTFFSGCAPSVLAARLPFNSELVAASLGNRLSEARTFSTQYTRRSRKTVFAVTAYRLAGCIREVTNGVELPNTPEACLTSY